MLSARLGLLSAGVAVGLWAQADVPVFTRPMRGDGGRIQLLRPGEGAVIYGSHLAAGICTEGLPPSGGPYPTELCDTQVTIGGVPAGLLFAGRNQINLKVPAGIPASGNAEMVVTVRGVRSAPVIVPVGTQKVVLSLTGPAYVHMPVWISLDRPAPGDIRYPYSFGPQSFGNGSLEVRSAGVMLEPLDIRPSGGMRVIAGPLNGSIAPADSPRERLPLHLRYRFDAPGKYEVRWVGTRMEPDPTGGLRTVQVDESDWTEIEILPYSEAQRWEWIQEQVAKMPSSPGLLMGDALPGLLALPDEVALAAILPELYHPDERVRRYVADCLGMFDTALLAKQLTPLIRQKGPTEELAQLLDRREDLFAGGHEAFIAMLPRFLSSDSPVVLAGALEYIAWEQNFAWGKTPEIRNQNSTMVLDAAPAIIERRDARLNHVLALALGSVKTDGARELLQEMIESGKAK